MPTPQEPQHEKLREELTSLTGQDPVLDEMLKAGGPLTRERYLNLAYGGDLPQEWTVEHELEVPEPLRDPKLFGR